MRLTFARLLASVATSKKKICFNSRSNQNRSAVLVAGKFETLGSNFSHEIRFCEAAGAVAIQNKSFIFLRPLPHTNE